MPQQIGDDAGKKSNAKLELIINNNQESQEDGSIDLVGVFRNFGKKRRLFLRLIAVLAIIGILVPLLMYQASQKRIVAISVISFTEGNGDTAPDGRPLNIEEFRSNKVISDALDSIVLSEELSIPQISRNISIERLLSKETRQKIAYAESIKDTYLDGAKLNELLRSIEYKYSNQYVITLKNGFGAENGNGKLTYIRDSELKALLRAIVASYSNYMYETYESHALPENVLESMDISGQEYNVVMNHLYNSIGSLKEYCDIKANAYPGYRSEVDGLSFEDIGHAVSLVDDINLTACSSYLYENGLSKNYEVAKTQYEYIITKYELALNETVTNIATVEKSIEEYKSDIIKISAEGQGDRETTVTSDYYKSLINRKLSLYEEKTSIEQEINDVKDHIQKLSSGNDPVKDSILEDKINNACVNIRDLYLLVYDHAEELFETGYVKNHFIVSSFTTSDGTVESDGITSISEENQTNDSVVKKMVIGVAVAVVLGFVIWIIDAFATEVKKGHGDGEKRD